MDFQAIRAKKEHAAELGYIHSESWQQAYKGIVPDEVLDGFTIEARTKVFAEAADTRTEECYLFKADGQPAGLAVLYGSHEENAPETVGEIYGIYFHPDYWGTPVTHQGFQFCVDRLKELGFSEITIWMLKDNIRARKFYEKHGFTFDGTEKEILIGKTLIEIRYAKKLMP